MPSRYTRRILDHLKHDSYEPANIERLAQELAVEAADTEALGAAVQQLAAAEQLVVDPSGKIKLPTMPAEITGSFKKNPRGFGFVKPDKAYRAHGRSRAR